MPDLDPACPACSDTKCAYWRMLKRHKPLTADRSLPSLEGTLDKILNADSEHEQMRALDAALCEALDYQFSSTMGMFQDAMERYLQIESEVYLKERLDALTKKHAQCRSLHCVKCAERNMVAAQLKYQEELTLWAEERYPRSSQNTEVGG